MIPDTQERLQKNLHFRQLWVATGAQEKRSIFSLNPNGDLEGNRGTLKKRNRQRQKIINTELSQLSPSQGVKNFEWEAEMPKCLISSDKEAVRGYESPSCSHEQAQEHSCRATFVVQLPAEVFIGIVTQSPADPQRPLTVDPYS